MSSKIVIIGGGPAGLAAAYELHKHGQAPLLLEAESQLGGLAKTVNFGGFRFDLGGHRFFTKMPDILRLWDEILGDRLLTRRRLSRIYYRGKLFQYPLKPMEALLKLGAAQALRVAGSHLWARAFPVRSEDSFEAWVSNRFGRRLFEIFFKTYTEKVWGIPCTELSSDWASQRIRDLSLWKVLGDALRRPAPGRQSHSLIEEFLYPSKGPQEMWDEMARRAASGGATLLLGHRVVKVGVERGRAVSVTAKTADGREEEFDAGAVISTMPLRDLVLALDPPPPAPVLEAAGGLRFRAFLTVCLIVDAPCPFPDNWVYIHSPEIRMGRLQSFGNWSPEMVPDPRTSGLGLEYFAWRDDGLWGAPDASTVALGLAELERLGMMPGAPVRQGYIVRSPEAYPVYDGGYRDRLALLRGYLSGLANLHPCGRGGLHRYNNMDHSMLTGTLAARGALGESGDVWEVDADRGYLEEPAGDGS
jgi:protoporphyrinogen oxidase